MDSLPFAQLQAFLAVARTGNFSAAARDMHVSRSAVSQSVRQLEEQLRVVLVHRTSRSVALTDAGRRLVDGVAPAFAQTANTLVEVAAQPGEATGVLRLTLAHAAFPLVLAPVLRGVDRRRADVRASLADSMRSTSMKLRTNHFVPPYTAAPG
ncbi:MAG: LysR family transcriptional regulator [Polyangiaceae bacterium]